MRRRAAIILFDEDKIALIRRVRDNRIYYVFPGGGIENAETPAEAALREAREELGVDVEIGPCAVLLTDNGHEFYFPAVLTGGEFGSGSGEEFTAAETERGSYEAVWMPIKMLGSIQLYPEPLARKIADDPYRYVCHSALPEGL